MSDIVARLEVLARESGCLIDLSAILAQTSCPKITLHTKPPHKTEDSGEFIYITPTKKNNGVAYEVPRDNKGYGDPYESVGDYVPYIPSYDTGSPPKTGNPGNEHGSYPPRPGSGYGKPPVPSGPGYPPGTGNSGNPPKPDGPGFALYPPGPGRGNVIPPQPHQPGGYDPPKPEKPQIPGGWTPPEPEEPGKPDYPLPYVPEKPDPPKTSTSKIRSAKTSSSTTSSVKTSTSKTNTSKTTILKTSTSKPVSSTTSSAKSVTSKTSTSTTSSVKTSTSKTTTSKTSKPKTSTSKTNTSKTTTSKTSTSKPVPSTTSSAKSVTSKTSTSTSSTLKPSSSKPASPKPSTSKPSFPKPSASRPSYPKPSKPVYDDFEPYYPTGGSGDESDHPADEESGTSECTDIVDDGQDICSESTVALDYELLVLLDLLSEKQLEDYLKDLEILGKEESFNFGLGNVKIDPLLVKVPLKGKSEDGGCDGSVSEDYDYTYDVGYDTENGGYEDENDSGTYYDSESEYDDYDYGNGFDYLDRRASKKSQKRILSYYQPVCHVGFNGERQNEAEYDHAEDFNHCLGLCHAAAARQTLGSCEVVVCAAAQFEFTDTGDNCAWIVASESQPVYDDEIEEREDSYVFFRN